MEPNLPPRIKVPPPRLEEDRVPDFLAHRPVSPAPAPKPPRPERPKSDSKSHSRAYWVVGVLATVILVTTVLAANHLPPFKPAYADIDPVVALKQDDVDLLRERGTVALELAATNSDTVSQESNLEAELTKRFGSETAVASKNPNGGGITLNSLLQGVSLGRVIDPAKTPLMYNSLAWPDGGRSVFFADGNCRYVEALEWKNVCAARTLTRSLVLKEVVVPPSPQVVVVRERADAPSSSNTAYSATTPTPTYNGRDDMRTQYVDGRPILVPASFRFEKGFRPPDCDLYTWTSRDGKAYVKMESHPASGGDLYTGVLALESGFANSRRYRYRRVNIRTGSEAFKNGVIWNYRIAKDRGPMTKKASAYFDISGRSYALVTSYPEADAYDFYEGVMTASLMSLTRF